MDILKQHLKTSATAVHVLRGLYCVNFIWHTVMAKSFEKDTNIHFTKFGASVSLDMCQILLWNTEV